MVAIKILLVLVSLTMSRKAYAVDALQFPLNVPSSVVTESSPELSNESTLLARSVALVVNSVLVIVFVRDSLMERSSSSSCCCTIRTSLSSAVSKADAGNGSLATRSSVCVLASSDRISTVSPEAGR